MAKGAITVDTKHLDRLTMELKNIEKQIPGASAAALNRTLDFMATKIGRIVPKEYAIKASEVKGSLSKKKASKNDLSANIVSRGHTLSIAHFPHSPKSPGSNRKNIKVKIKKNEGYKKIGTNPKPFVATTGSKGNGGTLFNVFRRTTSKRLPIVVLRTLSIPQMLGNENIETVILKEAMVKLEERISHEVNWRLDRAEANLKRG